MSCRCCSRICCRHWVWHTSSSTFNVQTVVPTELHHHLAHGPSRTKQHVEVCYWQEQQQQKNSYHLMENKVLPHPHIFVVSALFCFSFITMGCNYSQELENCLPHLLLLFLIWRVVDSIRSPPPSGTEVHLHRSLGDREKDQHILRINHWSARCWKWHYDPQTLLWAGECFLMVLHLDLKKIVC